MQQTNSPSAGATPSPALISRGPIRGLLDLLSSVPLGIVLLVILFFYSWIGSAGLFYPTSWHVFDSEVWVSTFPRQWRGLEMTEFEWFHTRFFNALIGLICLNLTVTTIRRIRFGWVNLGVWMIHAGIVVLCIGSVIYFGTKLEGDAPVIRRSVSITFAGMSRPLVIPVLPGNRMEVEVPAATGKDGKVQSGGSYTFEIADINPRWPIQSDENKGKSAYSVSVAVTTPTAQYIRQLLDGYPQYTEDIIPGKGRARKQPEFGGKATIDDSLSMSLVYQPQDHFWLRDSAAVYLRPHSDHPGPWSQRPISGLPRYNDYVASLDHVWNPEGDGGAALRPDPISIDVPAGDSADPARDVKMRVTGYLRYAILHSEFIDGGASLNPVVDVTFSNPQQAGSQTLQLAALDPEHSTAVNGLVAFRWVSDKEQLDRLRSSAQRRLTITVPGLDKPFEATIDPQNFRKSDGPWLEIPGTAYSYRVQDAADNIRMTLENGTPANVWFLVLEIKTPKGVITRYVADDPNNTRDVTAASSAGHGMAAPDPEVRTEYRPAMLAPVTLIAGPGDLGLRVVFNITGEPAREEALSIGKRITVNSMLNMRVNSYTPTAREETRPEIVPLAQRDKDADRSFDNSMIRLELTQGGKSTSLWLPLRRYSVADEAVADIAPSRYPIDTVTLSDGRELDVIFSHESRPLPARVALDDFILTANVGGFEPGKTGSIRDWTSVLRFEDPEQLATGGWLPPVKISTNDPTSHHGYWFFQSFWDPPRGPRFQGDSPSQGLNFTGLGVGNREGVHIQLAGCCISVIGMLYAFYVKPIIKRRRREKVLGSLATSRHAAAPPADSNANGHLVGAAPVGADTEDSR